MNIIIAGGRDFDNYELLNQKCSIVINSLIFKDNINIVSGKADGTDSLGERFAKENGYNVLEFPAEWDNLNAVPCIIKVKKDGKEYNSLAGTNRNEKMAKIGNILIAFWDGKSKGTKNMIRLAKKYNLETYIIKY